MNTVTIQEAQTNLAGLISQLRPGEEVVITQDDRPVARVVAEPAVPGRARRPGSAVGKLRIIEEDDSHLDDFREYMP